MVLTKKLARAILVLLDIWGIVGGEALSRYVPGSGRISLEYRSQSRAS